MRLPRLAIFAFAFSTALLAPAYARGGGGGHGGGGGGHAGGVRGGGVSRGGVVVTGGYRGGYYRAPAYYYGPSLYFGVGAYPAYGYYGYDPYYYGAPYGYGYPPPPVTIQPGEVPAQPNEAPAAPAQPGAQSQPQSSRNVQGQYYLVAFTDHSIQAATAYKVEGDQFHWRTREGKELQVPLSKVDVSYSQQLNHDRGVEFPIP